MNQRFSPDGDRILLGGEPVAESVLESLPVAVTVHDSRGELLFANRMALSLLGMPLSDPPSEPASLESWRFFNRDGSVMALEEFPVSLVLNWKKPLRDHLVGYRPSGSKKTVWGMVNADPVFGPDGEVDRVVVAFMAVTAQKVAEDKLKESESRFRLIADNIRDIFWMSTPDLDTMVYVSPAYEHIWGRSLDSLYAEPRSFLDAVHPQDRRRLAQVMQSGGDEPKIVEYRIIRPDGGVRWVRDRAFPVLDANGDRIYMVGVSTDVTEIVRARQEAQSKNEMLQGLFDNLPLQVFVKDGRGRFLMINREYEKVHGRRVEDVVGKTIYEIFPREVAERFERDDQAVITSGRPLAGEDDLAIAGEVRTFSRIMFPLSGGQGGPNGLCGLVQDVTDRRRAEDELIAAKERAEAGNRAKSRFLTTVRHELNTPLNGILGMAELLSDTDLDPEQRGYLKGLNDAAEALRSLISRVIAFTAIEEGEAAPLEEPFNLHALLDSLSGTMSVLAARKRLLFTMDVAPGVPAFLTGDGDKLREIFQQLASNAVKFTVQGSVSVSVRFQGQEGREGEGAGEEGRLVFTVRDTGVGVMPGDQERIFEPFTQADSSLARRYGGSGLGLSVARGLARGMGGEISLESQPGRGSEFVFTVPLKLPATLYK